MLVGGIRDGRKNLGLGFSAGRKMEEAELEEGEACSYQDEDESCDPDSAFSYIDEKIQNVLGHFQKDFEDGVSAENLGAKFGGYGSFLPTYQRSPALSLQKTPPKLHNSNIFGSPESSQAEGGQHNSLVKTSAHMVRRGSTTTNIATLPTKAAQSSLDSSKYNVCKGNAEGHDRGSKIANKSTNPAEHNPLKVRFRFGSSDNLTSQNNAAIYNGLGLDVSPTSSLEDSPIDIEGLSCALNDESPNSVLQMMTSFPVHGSVLLSPLPYDLVSLTEKEKLLRDNVQGKCKVLGQKKIRPTKKSNRSLELKNVNNKDPQSNTAVVKKKEIDTITMGCEELVNNALKLPLISNSYGIGSDFVKGANRISDVSYKDSKCTVKGDFLYDMIHIQGVVSTEKVRGDVKESFVGLSGIDMRQGNYLQEEKIYDAVKTESNASKGRKTTNSYQKTKSKGSKIHNAVAAEIPKARSMFKLKKRKTSENNLFTSEPEKLRSQKDLGKASDIYRDFFGDIPLKQEENEVDSFEIPSSNGQSKFPYNGLKERSSEKKIETHPIMEAYPKPAPNLASFIGNRPISDVALPIENNDIWVSCDMCLKWRLLPNSIDPDKLPEKWLCSMLTWLPGMNRCSVGQEETTNSAIALNQGLSQTQNNGLDGLVSGIAPADVQYPDQNHQHHSFIPMPSEAKKKHETKETSDVEKYRSKKKDKELLLEQYSDKGNTHSKMKSKREKDQDVEEASKKSKKEDDWMPEHEKAIRKAGPSSSKGLLTDSAGKDQSNSKQGSSSKDSKFYKKDNFKVSIIKVRDQADVSLNEKPLDLQKCNNTDMVARKRKSKECEDNQVNSGSHVSTEFHSQDNGYDHRKDKKARVPKYDGKDIIIKCKSRSEQKDSTRNDQHVGQDLERTVSQHSNNGMDNFKKELGPSQPVAATSSSSKVSGSHKSKSNSRELKSSPVESVSSSPLRKDKSITHHGSLNHFTDSKSETHVASPEIIKGHLMNGNADILGQYSNKPQDSERFHNEGRSDKKHYGGNGSHQRKSSKGLFSRSKDKIYSSKSDYDKHKNSDSKDAAQDHKFPYEENTNNCKGMVRKIESEKACKRESGAKFSGECSKRENLSKSGGYGGADVKVEHNQDSIHIDGERFQKVISDKTELKSGRGRSVPLPPSGREKSITQTRFQQVPVPLKENGSCNIAVDGSEGNEEALKGSKLNKKAENENGGLQMNPRHATPNGQRIRELDAPSPVKRDSSTQAVTNAVKEAKDLKHLADRLKNTGSGREGNMYYFQAALKFLYGASILESCSGEGFKHVDQSMEMYSSTAKLCEFCAHEYERSKDMASAALAYKCMEVAYMRVIYNSNSSASRDRNELYTALQMLPPGESPSSSASDVDNLMNVTTVEKVAFGKGVCSPQVTGSHAIIARSRPSFVRLLNYAQDVNFAMEASKKSRIAFGAATGSMERKEISLVKSALDFNFHDVEGLIHLVRVAINALHQE